MPVEISLDEAGIERTALTAQVYERLLERVSSRQFAPGQRLSIDQLARELRVSATPVREALARLSSQRLLQFEPYKGYRVLPAMDATLIDQLFEARLAVEESAVRSGVPRLEAAHVAALAKSVASMQALPLDGTSAAIQSFNDNDRAFHHLLIEISGNSFLIDMYDTLSPHIHIGRFYYHGGVLSAQAIMDEHSEIVAAYRRRDAAEAIERLRAHLMAARARLSEALRTRLTSG